MPGTVLFSGGIRSGKSAAAEQYAARLGRPVVYLATAAAGDDEMRARIASHRSRRPGEWQTVEAQQQVGAALRSLAEETVVLLDCLTLLVSNVLLAHQDDPLPALDREIAEILQAVAERQLTLIVVTSEVGLGLVPPNPLGRQYCDLLGWAAQRLAAQAQEVYFVMLGIPVEMRALQASWARKAAEQQLQL